MSTMITWIGIAVAALLVAWLVWHVVDRDRRVEIRNRAGKVVGWKRVVGPVGEPQSFQLHRPRPVRKRSSARAAVRSSHRSPGQRRTVRS